MRSTCSVYVDVGYLLASAATRVTGTSLRNGVYIDYGTLIDSITRAVEARCGLPVLRVHWYDSARNGVPDAQQQRIGELSKVKLRLGRFGVDGQQKGVDLRIGLDLVAHARNGASDVFFLISGDDDLTEAVEEAQVHGVQVVVLAVPNAEDKPHGVSRHLIRAADDLELMSTQTVDESVMKVEVPRVSESAPTPQIPAHIPAPTPLILAGRANAPTPRDVAALARPEPAAPASVLAYSGSTGGTSHVIAGYDDAEHDHKIDQVARGVLRAFLLGASPQEVLDLKRGKPSIPRDIDRALLTDASDALEIYDVNEGVRYRLRARFWEIVDE